MIEKRINGNDKAPWFRCRGCKKNYWAENWHCKHCHETLDHKVDWHSADNKCVPPNRMGWELDDGTWVEK